jgi:pyruvate formate-lyase activating enzyme-like uncharacterized protein
MPKPKANKEAETIATATATTAVAPEVPLTTTLEPSDVQESNEKNDPSKINCNAIRRNINMYLATEEMSQSDFLQAIGSDLESFNEFMMLAGKDRGMDNKTCTGAVKFFEERERKEREERKAEKKSYYVKKRKLEDDPALCLEPTTIPSSTQTPYEIAKLTPAKPVSISKQDTKPEVYDLIDQIRSIPLPEEENVYDDCDEVRRKVSLFIAEECGSIAKFAFAIRSTPATVDKFLSRSGKDQGIFVCPSLNPNYSFFPLHSAQALDQMFIKNHFSSLKNYEF